jgi:hypothetical protein
MGKAELFRLAHVLTAQRMEACHAFSGTLDDRRADHSHRITQCFSSYLNDCG